jgi:hypothetical protein
MTVSASISYESKPPPRTEFSKHWLPLLTSPRGWMSGARCLVSTLDKISSSLRLGAGGGGACCGGTMAGPAPSRVGGSGTTGPAAAF